ncbi:MAG: pyridoxal phosphate-dependent aminotransferase [Syntrophales bacterium]|jgi:aspartate aminotransferase
MKLSSRLNRIKPSATLAITTKAVALRAAGRDVIGFGAGEPDFDTPEHIRKAAIEAIEAGFTRYTPVGGIDELKDAIVDKLELDNGLTYKRSQVVVSCGAKHTLYNLAQVLFEAGDEVLIPGPYWVSYPDIVTLSDAKPVILETDEKEGFKVDAARLERAIGRHTKALILNSPSNPTGAAYSPNELKSLAGVLVGKDLLVITDDIYEKIIYDNIPFSNIASVSEAMIPKTIVVNGVSKAYAMTGWRIGYAAGPEDIIAGVTKIQSQNTSNPTSISQKAAVAALRGDQTPVKTMVVEFQKRRDFIVTALNAVEGISCLKPQGAFYVFPNISALFGKSHGTLTIRSSADLAGYLLDEANVAVVAGDSFGDDRFIRLSYATSMKNIEKGMERIGEALSKLK